MIGCPVIGVPTSISWIPIPPVLIAAWDYVEATGDTAWLQRTLGQLEIIGEFIAGRDIDGDGMVEAVQSGNYGHAVASCAGLFLVGCRQ